MATRQRKTSSWILAVIAVIAVLCWLAFNILAGAPGRS
jgi:hypothetical protein